MKIIQIHSEEDVPEGMVRLDDTFHPVVAEQMDWYQIQYHLRVNPAERRPVWVYVQKKAHQAYLRGTPFIDDTPEPPQPLPQAKPPATPLAPRPPSPPTPAASANHHPIRTMPTSTATTHPSIEILKAALKAADGNQAKIYNAISACMASSDLDQKAICEGSEMSRAWTGLFAHMQHLTDEVFAALHADVIQSKTADMLSALDDADQNDCLKDLIKRGLRGKFANEAVRQKVEDNSHKLRVKEPLRGKWPHREPQQQALATLVQGMSIELSAPQAPVIPLDPVLETPAAPPASSPPHVAVAISISTPAPATPVAADEAPASNGAAANHRSLSAVPPKIHDTLFGTDTGNEIIAAIFYLIGQADETLTALTSIPAPRLVTAVLDPVEELRLRGYVQALGNKVALFGSLLELAAKNRTI